MIQPVFDFTAKMPPKFDGDTIIEGWDAERLTGQWKRVYDVMKSGDWYTLSELMHIIFVHTGHNDSMTGISARIRDFRKARFGGHVVNSRRRGDPKRGLHEYQLVVK